MKQLLLIITLLLSTASFAQHITMDEIDKFTDDRKIHINASKEAKWSTSDSFTKNLFRGESFLSTTLIKDPEGKIFTFLNIQIITNFMLCFNDNKIIFLLENNDKVTLKQISKLDCSKNQTVKYTLEEKDINILKNVKIKEVRMYVSEGYVDYVVKDKMKPIIQKTFELTASKLKEIQNN